MASSSWTESRIRQLIVEKIEENLHLDFKAAKSLENRDEIVKDVAAFANSDGGTIIYGLREDPENRHLAGAIDPSDRKSVSKEWIEQILERAEPRLEGVIIHPVSIGHDDSQVVYVVEIPRSRSVHQSPDGKYYRRDNFKNRQMHDFEIREAMNRTLHPQIVLEAQLILGIGPESSRFLIRLTNVGSKIAKQFLCRVRLPLNIGARRISINDSHIFHLDEDSDGWSLCSRMGQPLNRTPLFPQDEVILRMELESNVNRWTNTTTGLLLESAPLVKIVVFADEMEPIRASFDPVSLLGNWIAWPIPAEV